MEKQAYITTGLLVLLVIMGVVGCGSAKNKEREEVFSVGAVLPLTGNSAQYGRYIQEGIELAVKEINAKGGVGGKRLKVIYEDSQCNPSTAVTAMQKLALTDNVPVVLGDWCSSDVLAMAPIAEETKTVIMAEAIAPPIRYAGDYVFRIQPDALFYVDALVPFVYTNLSIKKAAILYINNDFGIGLKDYFEKQFLDIGGNITVIEAFEPGAADFRVELLKIKKSKAEGIFIPSYAKEASLILKQSRELGIDATFFGPPALENGDIIMIAGDAAEGVVYAYHFDQKSEDSRVRQFQRAYQAAYGRSAEGFAVLMYDAVKILHPIFERCEKNTACIKSELYQVKGYEGVTGTTSFDEYGDVTKLIIIKTIRNGTFVRYS